MAGGVVAFEGELNAIVKEYLGFNSFNRTSSVFDRECTERGKPIAPLDGKPKVNQKLLAVQNELLQTFQKGDRLGFLKLWQTHLSETIRNEDPVAQKLEFYLNIYFAIYPLKYGTGGAEEGMNAFKTYLETRGSSLSQTTEFLPFYALPFVPNPKNHPSYKELFSEKWVPDLKTRLQKFLTLALQSTPQPRLFELYKGGSGSRDVHSVEQKAVESERKAVTYMKRYNRVQTDYHNLIGITADLVDSLEQTVQGNPVSLEYLQQICMRLFSNQVRQSVDFTRPGTAGEVLRQSVVPPQGLQHKEAAPGGSFDYNKIKRDLTNAAEKPRGLLLQALRWKLTKSAPPERDTMLTAFINNDLLGCTSDGQHRRAVLELLHHSSELVTQYTARLFNAFASLCEGRSYLSQSPDLLRSLMQSLKDDCGDALSRENILGTLQKLSLKRNLQTIMIEEGIINWLISVLEDNDNLSDYTLEYSVALLMNLCLRTTGKKKCSENAHQILKVLSDLLGHENQEIIPYVNGTLYSILAIPSIREEAKAMGMEEILRCFIKEGQADMNRQIEFIIKQLNSNEDPDENNESDDEEEEEDEEDQDAMEVDIDKNELLKPNANEINGDRFLHTYYVNTASSGNRKKRATDGVMAQEDLLRRPVTPSHMKAGGDNPVVHVQPRARPPTGRPTSSRGTSRPSSRDIHRPPTRSGSRPNSQDGSTSVQSKSSGHRKQSNGALKPSKKALDTLENKNVNLDEYQSAFGSRPKVPRTPDVSGGTRPTSRGSIGEGPTPQPKYSESLPSARPGSGGRPSSSKSPSPRTPRAGSKPSHGKLQ